MKMCLGCGATEQEGVVFTCANPRSGMGLCRNCARVPFRELVEMINRTAQVKIMAARAALPRVVS